MDLLITSSYDLSMYTTLSLDGSYGRRSELSSALAKTTIKSEIHFRLFNWPTSLNGQFLIDCFPKEIENGDFQGVFLSVI